MQIPSGHQSIMPYIMIDDANKFIDFTKKVFNAKHTFNRLREDQKTVMHAEIQINGSTIMFCDKTDDWSAHPANMFIYVDNADETYKLALENGAVTRMELSNQDYGRTCGINDPFGNTWWITSVN